MILLEKLLLLKGISIFAEISDELLAELAFHAQIETANPGQYIMHKGDVGDTLYVIIKGKVVVEVDKKVLSEFGEGEFFGELAVLSPEPRSASIRVLEPSEFLTLKREDLIERFGFDPKLMSGIITALCDRIRKITKKMS
jgi:CRP/FNR family cyclic AMP-dependent transcriptional regulator